MTEVVLVRWPDEEQRRLRLSADKRPRLLVVAAGVTAPAVSDCLEDWVRVPADEADVRARIENLTHRAARHRRGAAPVIDADGVLRCGGGWVSLPPVEARLTRALVDRFGAVVGREALARAGWPEGAPRRNALDVHVLRLRRRLAPVPLSIKTVRSRGYLLEEVER